MEDSDTTSGSGEFQPAEPIKTITSEHLNDVSPDNIKLKGILKLIIISLFFYAGNFFWSWTPISNAYKITIPIAFLGRLIIYPNLIRLKNYDLGWPYYSILIITPIFIIFDVAILAGSKFIFYASYMPIELILILLTLKRLIAINNPNSEIINFISKIVFIEGILFAISFILGTAFMLILYLQMQISSNIRDLLMTFWIGTMPLVALQIAMSAILIYAAWQIRRDLISDPNCAIKSVNNLR